MVMEILTARRFQVDVNADTANSQPYLNDVTLPDRFTPDSPAQLQLSSTDVEGDAVDYSAQVVSGNATASVGTDGLLTVTPATGFTGEVDVVATVRAAVGAGGDSDNQQFTFNFEASSTAPTSIDLRASSDSGSSDTDNVTNLGSLDFTVTGVQSGALVEILDLQTATVLGNTVATGSSVTITTDNVPALGDGTYEIAARQTVGGEVSDNSPSISVTYDSTAPADVTSSAIVRANVGRTYTTDLISDEEGSITYELTDAPTGSSIDVGSGVIQWTPEAGRRRRK